ncbi:MAG: HEPN domain-containing protein [Wujia sp.]
MCAINSFKLAFHSWDMADKALKHAYNDEMFIRDVAYNIQQCIEKTLKAFLECKGVTVPQTHKVEKLIRMSRDNGSAVIITDWIAANSYKLESWEAESRYNIEFIAELNEVVEALNETKKFLDINGLTFIREAKITEDVEKSLRDLMPKDIVIADDFELNCYYHVFEKKLQDKELCSNGGN